MLFFFKLKIQFSQLLFTFVLVFSVDGLYEVNLDRRKLKTPGGKLFTVPNEALAIAVATEWDAQRDTLKTYTMHLVRLLECVLSALLLFNITQQIVIAYVIAVVSFTSLLPKQSFQIISSENLMLFFFPHVCIYYKDESI